MVSVGTSGGPGINSYRYSGESSLKCDRIRIRTVQPCARAATAACAADTRFARKLPYSIGIRVPTSTHCPPATARSRGPWQLRARRIIDAALFALPHATSRVHLFGVRRGHRSRRRSCSFLRARRPPSPRSDPSRRCGATSAGSPPPCAPAGCAVASWPRRRATR